MCLQVCISLHTGQTFHTNGEIHKEHGQIRKGDRMRVTLDIDSQNWLKLKWVCIKGRLLCRKPVDRIHKTRRGYHCIWDDVRDKGGNPITEEKVVELRKKLGDDENRIHLDSHTRRLHQVLFQEKTISYLEDGYITKQETFQRKRIK